MKSWLQDNDIKIYSTHNERKSLVGERFIRTLEQNLQVYDFNIKNVFMNKYMTYFINTTINIIAQSK